MQSANPQAGESDLEGIKHELECLHSESFGWAMACCSRNPMLAEDVLQTVYLKILEGKARYGHRASFKTWLFAVIRQTANSEARRAALRGLLLGRYAGWAKATHVESFDQAIDDADGRRTLRAALARLSARQREVMQLVFYHDLSIEEAAGVVGVSVGTARVHYDRGKKRLRELLGEEEGSQWSRVLKNAESR